MKRFSGVSGEIFHFSRLFLFALTLMSCANDFGFKSVSRSENQDKSGAFDQSKTPDEVYPGGGADKTNVIEVGNPGSQSGTGSGGKKRTLNIFLHSPDSGAYSAAKTQVESVAISFNDGTRLERNYDPPYAAVFSANSDLGSNVLALELDDSSIGKSIMSLNLLLMNQGEVELFATDKMLNPVTKRISAGRIEVLTADIVDSGSRDLKTTLSFAVVDSAGAGSSEVSISARLLSGDSEDKVFSGKVSCHDGSYWFTEKCFTKKVLMSQLFGFCEGKTSSDLQNSGVSQFSIKETCSN